MSNLSSPEAVLAEILTAISVPEATGNETLEQLGVVDGYELLIIATALKLKFGIILNTNGKYEALRQLALAESLRAHPDDPARGDVDAIIKYVTPNQIVAAYVPAEAKMEESMVLAEA